MYTSQLFESSSQVVAWLRKIAQPMRDAAGAIVPNAGCVRVGLPFSVVETLLPAERIERGTSKRTVYQFVVDKKNYTLMVRSTRNGNKNCVFIWNHPDASAS